MDLTRFRGIGEKILAERRVDAHDVTIWEWCSPRETTKNLTRPEVARCVIQMTKELADLLGIPLGEVTRNG